MAGCRLTVRKSDKWSIKAHPFWSIKAPLVGIPFRKHLKSLILGTWHSACFVFARQFRNGGNMTQEKAREQRNLMAAIEDAAATLRDQFRALAGNNEPTLSPREMERILHSLRENINTACSAWGAE